MGRGRQSTIMSRATSSADIVMFHTPKSYVVLPNSFQKLDIGVAENIADCQVWLARCCLRSGLCGDKL